MSSRSEASRRSPSYWAFGRTWGDAVRERLSDRAAKMPGDLLELGPMLTNRTGQALTPEEAGMLPDGPQEW